VRAATAEPEVAAVVRERMAEPMVIPLAKAAGGDDPEYRAMLVITQLLGLVMGRYILKIEPLASRPVADVVADLPAPLFAPESPCWMLSISLRTTGASTVEDAERTNSPRSWSLAITTLLSTPSSLASS